MDNFLEHCWVLLGHREGDLWWGHMHQMTVGAPCSVAFDPDYVLRREEEKGDVVGFYHTHPGFSAYPSSRDDATMHQWVCSFGKPLVCLIRGVDGLRAWWYVDDESPAEEFQVKRTGTFLFGVTPELYELPKSDPIEGLELEDDPNARPIEEFLPDDEKAEWLALQKELSEDKRRNSPGPDQRLGVVKSQKTDSAVQVKNL